MQRHWKFRVGRRAWGVHNVFILGESECTIAFIADVLEWETQLGKFQMYA
jgi:hypothetical protein